MLNQKQVSGSFPQNQGVQQAGFRNASLLFDKATLRNYTVIPIVKQDLAKITKSDVTELSYGAHLKPWQPPLLQRVTEFLQRVTDFTARILRSSN